MMIIYLYILGKFQRDIPVYNRKVDDDAPHQPGSFGNTERGRCMTKMDGFVLILLKSSSLLISYNQLAMVFNSCIIDAVPVPHTVQ
jgi:hypothetical protein